MTPPDTIRLYGTAPDSIVDGPGLRFAVFVQGCTHGCPGCHNPDSQPSCGGDVRRIDDLAAEIAANKLAQGVTISGGEPFEQAAASAELARKARSLGLNVWTYTGCTYEDLVALASRGAQAFDAPRALPAVDPTGAAALLDATDVLVDGPFVQKLHSFDLPWRGSCNQRLIDVPATRAAGRIVLWDTHEDFPEKPASW